MHKLAVLVGSLRRESINRKFAEGLEKLAEGKFTFDYPDLDLPLYNHDLWEDTPQGVTDLKDRVGAADAVLFVTPEYNRSFTPAIKNAIDWGSKPVGENVWSGKPAAITGASPGKVGTAAAQVQLRSLVAGLGTILMTHPEVYLEFKEEMFDGSGAFKPGDTRDFLQRYIDRFAAWTERMVSSA